MISILVAVLLGAAYVLAVLKVEGLPEIAGLLAAGTVALAAAAWLGLLDRLAAAMARHRVLGGLALVMAGIGIVAGCHTDHFALIVVASMLALATGVVGIERHVAGAGVPDMGGAALQALGAYVAGGAIFGLGIGHAAGLGLAAVAGGLAALPLLTLTRERALHGALATLALGLAVERALKAGPVLGFEAGIKLPPLSLLGLDLGFGFEVGPYQVSPYAAHALLGLGLLVLALGLAALAGTSRTAQLAAGGVALGLSGALQAVTASFVGAEMFGVVESLVLISLAVIGGLGNVTGVVVVALFAGLLLGKLQILQELRAPLALLVLLLMLWLRPQGLAATWQTGGRGPVQSLRDD